jgi:hypothetical protein
MEGRAIMALNTKLLTDLLTWAAADEESAQKAEAEPGLFKTPKGFTGSWNQHEWARKVRNGVCQTSYCLAGQTVVQAGKEIVYEAGAEYADVLHGASVHVTPASYCTEAYDTGEKNKKGKPIYSFNPDPSTWNLISTEAEQILGLKGEEEERLFSGENDLDDLFYHAASIVWNHRNEDGLKPPKFKSAALQEKFDAQYEGFVPTNDWTGVMPPQGTPAF